MLVFFWGVCYQHSGSALGPGERIKLEQAGCSLGSWNLLFFFLLDFPLKASVPHHLVQRVWRKWGGVAGCELLMILHQLHFISGLVVKEGVHTLKFTHLQFTGEEYSPLVQAPSTQPISDIPWSHFGPLQWHGLQVWKRDPEK